MHHHSSLFTTVLSTPYYPVCMYLYTCVSISSCLVTNPPKSDRLKVQVFAEFSILGSVV